ncbi:aquaporin 12 [Dunckerocampus dactyliophorus]|uniref:aquaporin 12 n=1 Tax=Dunckerocampus dactyliophorus TaxID=161453 RepID=UPI0024053BCF|nr:aquaporin 12 [Dunckerocampus dactyliophorus]
MSGLNASLGYFLACVVFGASLHPLLKKWPRLAFLLEFSSSFMLVACWLEVQTIVEIGEWAGGLGPDVTATILFVVLLTHGIISEGASGNPSLILMRFLQLEATVLTTVLAVVFQFLGAHLALHVAEYYWSLELTDMHMIKNLMSSECSTSLLASLLQGFFTECVCALIFNLVHLFLRRRSAFIRVPLIAILLTFLAHTAKGYTAAYINPSLAYGMTFFCPGFTLAEYAFVYWLAPVIGMTLALLLHMGHIPRIFAKNVLSFQKTRFRAPKSGAKDKKK